jgi:putative ABC transport system permease protein
MSTFGKDMAYAARVLGKRPAFAAIALITVALGIGASTAIFSVVNAVLLRPLPYRDADRLVLVWSDLRARDVRDFPLPPADFHDLREQATLFEAFAGVSPGRQALTGDGGEPEQVRVAGVTPNLISMLGARVLHGRDFVESDGTPQPPPPDPQGPNAQAAAPPPLPNVAILTHDFWQRRYGGDPSVVGRVLRVGGGSAEVVGVLAPGFELLFPPAVNVERVPDILFALRVNFAAGSRINVFLRVIGKLKEGVTVAQAQAQLDGIAAELRNQFPIKQTAGMYFRTEAMYDDLVADVRPAILALMGAVVFVLLIACANVANLFLVRASARERELAVRAALGGSRWRLVSQMLAESVILAASGALLGLLLARLGISLLLALRPANLPRLDDVGIDPMVLFFTMGAAILAALLSGVVPALRASRPDIAEVLRESGRTAGLGSGRLRNVVVVAEVALAFVLLIGSGLMIRSFVALHRANPGYDPEGLVTFFMPVPPSRGQAREAFLPELRDRLAALPGVTSVAATSSLPLDGSDPLARWGREEAATDPTKFEQGHFFSVMPGYIETMRTRLIEGRTFTAADNRPDALVMIIDELLAAKAFPNESALGKRLLVRVRGPEPEFVEVIGVIEHQRTTTLAADGEEGMYFTDGFFGHGNVARWAVRTDGDPLRLAPRVRAEIAAFEPLAAVAELQPMSVLVDRARTPTRFALTAIGIFAAIAALLAAVGLYGVLSTVVRSRTAEIGVRMAFGAPRGSIFQLFVGQGLRLSAAGVALGLLASLGLTRVMSTMLVEVRPTDPATFVAMAVFFFVIAGVASWLPAWRAAGLDPTAALREE